MIAFILLIRQLWLAMRTAWHEPEFRALIFLTLGVWVLGATFYHNVEGWRWLDSFYFCFVSLATVGYGDFTPKTDLGKIFTIFYIMIGIGLLVSFFTQLGQAVVISLRETRKMREAKGQANQNHSNSA
jgi:hypothetical protein